MNKKLLSERHVLRCIADIYESSYPGALLGENDPYLQIDIIALAERLNCTPELLFGYLYYYLDRKHRYQVGENVWTHLFALKVDEKRHCVNYPYLVGILAAHELEHRRNLWALGFSFSALVLSLASIVAQVVTSGNV